MRIWYNNVVDTERRLLEVSGNRLRIGRDPRNELVLHSPYVASEAAVLTQRSGQWEIRVLGVNGIKFGDEQLSAGQRREIKSNVAIEMFPFTLTLDLPRAEELSQHARIVALDDQLALVLGEIHRELLDRMDLRRGIDVTQQNDPVYQLQLERHLETIAGNHARLANTDSPLIFHLAGHALRDHLLRLDENRTTDNTTSPIAGDWSRIATTVPEREKELETTSNYLAKLLKLDAAQLRPTSNMSNLHVKLASQWINSNPDGDTEWPRAVDFAKRGQ